MQNAFPLRLISRRDTAHEDAFLARYKALSEHAIKLTRGNRDVAGDLLQDTFIYFTEAKPPLEEIDNLDAYIYSVLRYLHFAFLRKGMRDPIGELAAIDYESAELTLRAAPVFNRLYVCDELARVCELSVASKDESRPHCLLLLRFFHGYYLDELVQIAGNSDNTIRKWLREAQSELRAAMQGQSQERLQKNAWSKRLALSSRPEEFLRSLRQVLLSSAHNACPGRDEIRAQYSSFRPSEIKTELLSHLVVCGKCLDRVNGVLQIPLLAKRHADDIDHGRRPKNGPDSGAGGSMDRFDISSARRRRDAKIHHEPAKLIVRINGDERAVHDLGQESHHFVLKLSPREDVHLVEIVSEQDVSLLTFVIDDSQMSKPLEWRRVLEMTNRRILEATLRYGETWPSVEVVYCDPSVSRAVAESDRSSPFSETQFGAPILDKGIDRVDAKVEAPENLPNRHSSRDVTKSRQAEDADLLKPSRRWMFRIPLPKMNLFLAGTLLFALCSVSCFLLWTRSEPRISAGTLLDRAAHSDASAVKSARSEVIYQKVQISGSGHSMERAIYRDPKKKRRLKQQHLNANELWLKEKLNAASVNWDEPLSVDGYREWHDLLPAKRDVISRTGSNLLILTTTSDSSGVARRESLTVRESDFHPVARTIELRDAGTVEIAELNYDVMPWGAVNQDWFEPEAGDSLTVPVHRHSPMPAILPSAPSDGELDGAELGALVVLNNLHSDSGEQILVSRTSDGIEVKGVVETNQRKVQLASRLLQIPHVHPSLLSVEELGNYPQSGPARTDEPIQTYSVETQSSPLEQYLREKALPLDQLGSISQSLFDQSVRMHQAEVHLFELQQRFKNIDRLSIDQKRQLLELSRSYIDTIQSALVANRNTLLSIGLYSPEPNQPPLSSGAASEPLDLRVREYQRLCQQLIASRPGEQISATVIAEELTKSGSLIESGAGQTLTAFSSTHN